MLDREFKFVTNGNNESCDCGFEKFIKIAPKKYICAKCYQEKRSYIYE